MKAFWSALIAAMFLLSGRDAMADTFLSNASTGDPTLTTSWTNSAGTPPSDFVHGDTFTIQTGHKYTIAAGTTWTVNASSGGTAATVQINSGGTLAFNNTSGDGLALGGNLVRSGVITNLSASGGVTISFTSNGSWNGSGDVSLGGSTAKISITVNSGVTLDATPMTGGFKLGSSNTKNITVNGTLNLGANTVNGNGSGSSGFTLGTSGTLITATTSASGLPGIFTGFSAGKITLPITANYTFNGTAAQVTGTTANNATMPATVNNLTNNNSSTGLTLSQATTVNGTLALNTGKLTGNVTLGSSATLSGGSSTAYVNGQLTATFAAPTSASFTFPVGTAAAYSPVSIANFTDVGTGTLTASATASANPNQGSSGIDGSLYIARYWTLTDNGGFSSPTYDFTGTYVAGDIQNGADPANLIVRKWDGSSWAAPTASSSVAYTVTGTSFTTSFGQFAAGQAQTTFPILDSTTKTAITNTSATLGATLENNYSLAVTDYGIVWGTSANPTTAGNKVQVGTSTPAIPSAFTANVTGLPAATTIYYRGYAINSSSQTGYSTNGSFLTLANEPTTQASGVVCSTLQNGSIPISWTRGNGAKCIVLVSTSSPVDAPVDGTTYTANATFSSGTLVGSSHVAYLGTGTTVTLTGLSTSTTYYVAVYELNGSGGSENYLTDSPATGSQLTGSIFVTQLTWTGGQDIYWNNTNNWDQSILPDVGTPVIIPSAPANQPVYSNQMAAASFGGVTQAGTLNINTNGFNSGAVLLVNAATDKNTVGAQLFVNTNGVMSVNGNVALTSNSVVTVSSGGALTASGQLLIGSGPTGSASSGNVGSYGTVINNGGTINVGSTGINPTGYALTSASKSCLLVINGGTNNLGAVTVSRSYSSSTAFASLGTEGLMIYGGLVTMKGLNVGNGGASYLSAMIAGGIVTNNGSVFINQATSARGSRLLQTGGLFVVTNLVNPNPVAAGTLNIYSVTGGTNMVGGISFGYASGSAGNIYFTNGATMYVGSQGIAYDGAVTLSAVLSGGSLLGATADWTGSAPLQLDPGTATIQAADLNGTAHNITLSGALSGSGSLTKTGNGALTLNNADTYAGNTLVSAGTLALGVSGSLNNSAQILLGTSGIFDVTAVSGYTVASGKSLGGLGNLNGNVSYASGSTLLLGSNVVTGTLTFNNNLTLAGTSVVFNLAASPASDAVSVVGTLDLSAGGITVDVTGTGSAGSSCVLFGSGTLNGNLSNISLTPGAGAIGHLTLVGNAISYVVDKTVHSPTTVVWIGNQANNVWDSLVTTNWMLGGSLDYFINGDTATFTDAGQINSNVVINASITPAATTVNSSGDYVFSGTAGIGGLGGLTKTNSGRLTIQTTNTFTGGFTINQGTVSVATLAADNTPSPLGQTGTLLVDGGALQYTGPSTTWTRPITMGTNGGGIITLPTGSDLVYSGTISGSGSLTKSDLGTLTMSTGNSYSGGTYLNSGTLVLNSASGAGSGNLAFTGNSTLSLNAVSPANTIVLSNYSGVIKGNNTSSIKNVLGSSNLVIAVTSGTFDLVGDMSTYSGTLTTSNAASGTSVRLNGAIGSKLATWDTGSGAMDLNVRNKASASAPYFFGALQGGSSSTLTGPTGSDSAGHGSATYQIGDNGLSTTFAGVIQNGSDSSQVLSIVKTGTSKLTLSGANTYTGTTTVSNGTLEVNGSLGSSSTVTVKGGTLAGIGTIGGATTLNASAILSAGSSSVGTLTFSGNLTLNGTSTNRFAVTTGGGAANSVTVNGTLYPNGSVIQITSGTSLAVGTYTLFNYSGISGSFNATPVFDVAPAATASIVDTGSQIQLVIVTPGPSGPGTITNSISGSTLSLTWPTGQGWRLVSQTNDLTTGLNPDSSAWFTVPDVSDGSATITVDPTQPTVFYELVYP